MLRGSGRGCTIDKTGAREQRSGQCLSEPARDSLSATHNSWETTEQARNDPLRARTRPDSAELPE